jgi:hypothetical protein
MLGGRRRREKARESTVKQAKKTKGPWYLSRTNRRRVMSGQGKKTAVVWSPEDREAVVERVLAGMAEGKTLTETVAVLKRVLEEPITPGLVRRWIVAEEGYYTRYQKTKTMLGQAFAEEAILVARESTSSTTAMDRVLIETLKWAAAKANPVEYGEKQTVEHQGAQTLSVKIVEDDAPVRNQKALQAAQVSAVISAPLVFAVPAKTAEHEDDDYTFV